MNPADIWQLPGQATLAQAEILGTVGAIDDSVTHDLGRHVVGRRLRPPGRHRPRLHTEAGDILRLLARVDGLHERKLELPHLAHPLLHCRCEARNSAVLRIDDQRRSVADRSRVFEGVRFEGRVVRPGQVLQGASRRNALTSLGRGGRLLLPIGFTLSDLGVGQNLFAGIASGSLQRYLILLGPEALQVRFAPCCPDGALARGWLRL